MKNKTSAFQIAAVLASAMLFSCPAFGQPGVIDPVTGQPMGPATTKVKPGQIDFATGLRAPADPATRHALARPGEMTSNTGVDDAFAIGNEVKNLIFNNQYEEALQRCLAFHDQYKTSGPLFMLMPDWVELGRRYPKAKNALIEIRDKDMREFSEGRGFTELFREVNSINGALHQEDATYELYKSFGDKDPEMAKQCYAYVESLLVAKGEYHWCYDHMGEARGKFEMIRMGYNMQTASHKRMAEMAEQNKKRMAEMRQQHGLTELQAPAFQPPDTSAMAKQATENNFVTQTQRLIEILVGTGHKADAEWVRDQAMGVLDDARLKTAIADAEGRVRK